MAAVPDGRQAVFADNFLLAAGPGCDGGVGPGSGTSVSRQAYVEQEMWRAVHQQKQGSLGRTKNDQKAQKCCELVINLFVILCYNILVA